MNLFAIRVKELRTENLLTQKQLAEKIKCTQSNISEWEKGTVEPKATALTQLANLFNVSTDFLLGRTDEFGTNIISSSHTLRETELITMFRQMNTAQQNRFLGIAEGMIEESNKKKNI